MKSTHLITKEALPMPVPVEAAKEVVKLEALKREIESRLEILRGSLLEATKKNGVLSLKTEAYTISRATRQTIQVFNDQMAADFLKSKGVPVEMKTVLNMDYMKLPIKQYPGEIPGINIKETEYVSIRINKK